MLTLEQDKVLQGKNGYLFLINDSNRGIEQLAGKVNFNEKNLQDWQALLESRYSRLKKQNIAYFHLVVPNKECVYSDLLPDDIIVSEERCLRQLQRYLNENSFASIIYPLFDLKNARKERETYRKGDTHWNDFGAYIAYRCLAESIAAKIDYKIILPTDIEFISETTVNPSHFDLGNKIDWQEDLMLYHRLRSRKSKRIFDNEVNGTGRLCIYENQAQNLPKAVLFGDSFSHFIAPYIAESCSRLVLVQQQHLDYSIIEQEKPDFVVAEQIERFIIRLPDDLNGASNREIAAKKKGELLDKDRDDYIVQNNSIDSEPQTAKDYFARGKKYRESGEINKAIESLNLAIEIKNDYPQALLELAAIYQEQNKDREAFQCYQKLLELPLQQPAVIYLQLARLHGANNRLKESVLAYESAAKLKSDWTANFHREYAEALLKIQQPRAIDLALIQYEKALAKQQNWSASFYVTIAKLYEQKERWKESIDLYRQALKIDPQSTGIYIAVAEVLNRVGYKETAINCYRKAIEFKPDSYNARKQLGDIYREIGRKDEAIECYQKAIEIDPVNSQLIGLPETIFKLSS